MMNIAENAETVSKPADLDSYAEVDVAELLPPLEWEMESPKPTRTSASPTVSDPDARALRPVFELPPLVRRRPVPIGAAEHEENARRVAYAVARIAHARVWEQACDFNGRPFESLADYVASLGVDLTIIAALALDRPS